MFSKNHLFPFGLEKDKKIEHIDHYLNIESNNDSTKEYSTILMGRKLEGIQVTPKSNIKGNIWKQVKKTNEDTMDYDEDYVDTEEDNNKDQNIEWIRTDKNIDDFILWKKDIAPPSDDPRLIALDSWLDMADLIHQPIPLKQE
ncbi:hypothetical protein BJ944DRAFT_228282 [Cunninghamella echinulata]|nr:hypothetical protein BJ944DRAFT_228282 [Cunninghamella echinulata]